MSELREKIAEELCKSVLWSKSEQTTREFYALRMADRILAIPEIREGLYLYSRKKVKAGKPSREPTLGHSIGTRG
jgi:hypothetical protein